MNVIFQSATNAAGVVHQQDAGSFIIDVQNADRGGADLQPLKHIQVYAGIMRQSGLDEVAMTDYGDRRIAVPVIKLLDNGEHPRLRLQHGVTSRYPACAAKGVEALECRLLAQGFERAAGPLTAMKLHQIFLDDDLLLQLLRQRNGRLDRPFQRAAVNAGNGQMSDAFGKRLRLHMAFFIQMHARRAAGQTFADGIGGGMTNEQQSDHGICVGLSYFKVGTSRKRLAPVPSGRSIAKGVKLPLASLYNERFVRDQPP